MTDQPPIQLIATLVVTNSDGQVLLVRYAPDAEPEPTRGPAASADPPAERWWLPGAELEPYEHPDEAVRAALDDVAGITASEILLSGVDSFRGRRGWHVSFEYSIQASGEPSDAGVPARWFDLEAWPRTTHGRWERTVVDRVRSRDAVHASREDDALPTEPGATPIRTHV